MRRFCDDNRDEWFDFDGNKLVDGDVYEVCTQISPHCTNELRGHLLVIHGYSEFDWQKAEGLAKCQVRYFDMTTNKFLCSNDQPTHWLRHVATSQELDSLLPNEEMKLTVYKALDINYSIEVKRLDG